MHSAHVNHVTMQALAGKLEGLQAESDRVSSQKKKADLKCQALADKLAAEELVSQNPLLLLLLFFAICLNVARVIAFPSYYIYCTSAKTSCNTAHS